MAVAVRAAATGTWEECVSGFEECEREEWGRTGHGGEELYGLRGSEGGVCMDGMV